MATSIHTANLIAIYKHSLAELGRPADEDLINNDEDDDDFGDFFSSEETQYQSDGGGYDDDADFEYIDNYDKLDDF